MQADPNFHFMVGRLVGATEMLARYMQVHGDPQAKEMGQRADALLAFFYDKSDESTLILPPKNT
jgi:hypothetical protein